MSSGSGSASGPVSIDRHQPVDVQSAGDVDVDDAGVRVRRADDRRGQRVAAEVVEVRPAAHEQSAVLDPLDRLAEHLRHELNSAARRTAATMFW